VFLLAGGDIRASASVILGHTGTSTATWVRQHTSTVSSADHSIILSVTSYQNYPSISTHRDSHHTRHVNSFVISRGDYCNSLLHGLPAYQLTRVQSILNSRTLLLGSYTSTRFDHITPLLRDRLRVPECINYKLCLLVYWALNHLALQCESKKSPSLRTYGNFSKTVGNFSSKFYMPIMHSYLRWARVQIFIQSSSTLTKLCHIKRDHPVHIMCARCPLSAETHAGIFWHFLQTIPGIFSPNFTHILNVHTYARMQIFIQLGLSPTMTKLCNIKCDHPACVSVVVSMMDILSTLRWSRLIWHNFVKVADNWIKICSPA